MMQAADKLATTPTNRAELLVDLARLRLRQGRVSEALDCVTEAAHIAASVGGLGTGEHSLGLVRAEILVALGRHAEARTAIVKLASRLHERAAAFSDPVLRESYLARVQTHARILHWAASMPAEGPATPSHDR